MVAHRKDSACMLMLLLVLLPTLTLMLR